MYIGTDQSVISYFNGDIIPVNKLDQTGVSALAVNGRKIIAGTAFDGLLMKSGKVLKTLVPPDNGMNFDVLSLVP